MSITMVWTCHARQITTAYQQKGKIKANI